MPNRKLHLSQIQVNNLVKAIKTSTPVKLRFSIDQLRSNSGVMLPLTPTQIIKLDKAKAIGKGVMVSFSKAQIMQMKKDGGVLPVLAALAPFAIAALTGAAGAAGTFGANKLLGAIDKAIEKGKKEGSALFPPGYTGQTGNALVTYRPTGRGRGQKGGRRDAIKPVKPIFHKTDDILFAKEYTPIVGSALFPLGVKPKKKGNAIFQPGVRP